MVKPAIQAVPDSGLEGMEIVVTAYMDHAVGQMHAAAAAARIAPDACCGLVTHLLFEPDSFSERIALDGARLVAPAGTGVGFDDLLDGLPWERLA